MWSVNTLPKPGSAIACRASRGDRGRVGEAGERDAWVGERGHEILILALRTTG
jgi:hypothetical protein